MRRGLVPPLFSKELEPGEAIRQALHMVHPLHTDAVLSDSLQTNIAWVCGPSQTVLDFRTKQLASWEQQTHELLPATIFELSKVTHQHLRRFLS